MNTEKLELIREDLPYRPDLAALLLEAETRIREVCLALNNKSVKCDGCTARRYESWPEHSAVDALGPLPMKLRRWADAFEANAPKTPGTPDPNDPAAIRAISKP